MLTTENISTKGLGLIKNIESLTHQLLQMPMTSYNQLAIVEAIKEQTEELHEAILCMDIIKKSNETEEKADGREHEQPEPRPARNQGLFSDQTDFA